MRIKNFFVFLLIFITLLVGFVLIFRQTLTQHTVSQMPIIAIANYGPHSSLQASITGMKQALTKQGFIENKNIHYEIMDVSFDATLIPQMIARLKQFSPNVIVAITTPVAQFTKNSTRDIPIVYNVITDPVSAGLIQTPHSSYQNITGSSDKQNLVLFLNFAKNILPKAKMVGILYAPSEANDVALVKMMQEAAIATNMQVVALPIDHVRDMSIRLQALKNKVDFIYVGGSGPILPSLPIIAKSADKMGIPVFSVEPDAVKNGYVLASFGVDYHQVGQNTGKLISDILNKKNIADLTPLYPEEKNHHGYINQQKANALNISIPKQMPNLTIVGKKS